MQVRISHIYLQAFLQLVPLDMKNAAVSSSVRLSAPHRISTLFFSFVNSRQTSKGGRSEFPRRPIEIRVKNCCRCRNYVSAAIAQRGHVSYYMHPRPASCPNTPLVLILSFLYRRCKSFCIVICSHRFGLPSASLLKYGLISVRMALLYRLSYGTVAGLHFTNYRTIREG